MNNLLVAISQRVDFIESHKEFRDSLDHRLSEFVIHAGFIPSPIPNLLEEKLNKYLKGLNPGYIILSGGNDIGLCKVRDRTEQLLLEYSENNNIPILGICRGAQFIAQYYGASLVKIKGHVAKDHEIKIIHSSSVYLRNVNSYHSYSIYNCPDQFSTFAYCINDQSIEGISHKKRKCEGWMWHPERFNQFDTRDIDRLKSLFAT